MAARKRAQQIVPLIRGSFIRAAKSLEEEGVSLTDLIADQLKNKPLETLKVIAQFVPKEMLVEADISMQLEEMSDEAIDAEIRRLATETATSLIASGEAESVTH